MSIEKIPLIISNRGLIANIINAIAASPKQLKSKDDFIVYNVMRYFIPEFNYFLNRGQSIAIQDSSNRGFIYNGSMPYGLGIRDLDELSGPNLAYFCEQQDVKAILVKPEEKFGFESFYHCLYEL